MTDKPKSMGPVSLPAGSFDSEKLAAGLDAAVDRQKGNEGEEVDKAIDAARLDQATATRDPALLSDHVFVDVDNLHGGTERQQVYAPKLADAHRPAQQPVQPSALGGDDLDQRLRSNRDAIAEATKGVKVERLDAREESRTGAADPELAEDATSRPATEQSAENPGDEERQGGRSRK